MRVKTASPTTASGGALGDDAKATPRQQHRPLERGRALPGFPNGWFAVGYAHELKPGGVLARRLAGHDLVVFRTQAGVACAMDAYCPHLGAHFAYGGTVEGEVIRCPFHGFCFDQHGTCVATGYTTKPPPTARVRVWPLEEVNGVLLVYYDAAGRPPAWHIPPFAREGWTPLIGGLWRIRSHPQEITENSVDLGHLTWVHGYQSVEMIGDLLVDGPRLQARYAMRRPAGLFGKSKTGMRVEFHAQVFGLGYSQVEVRVPAYGVHSLHLVLPTPIDEGWLELRAAITMEPIARPQQINPFLSLMPRGLLNWIIARQTYKGYAHDVQQDFPIWEQKHYIQPPALAAGDGPIGKYRTWVRQFYSDPLPPV